MRVMSYTPKNRFIVFRHAKYHIPVFFYDKICILCMEVCPSSYFQWCRYFGCPWVWFVLKISSQWWSQKLLQGLVSNELTAYLSIFNLFLTVWIMVILSKCKPDKFEQHLEKSNSLKLSKYLTPLFKFS